MGARRPGLVALRLHLTDPRWHYAIYAPIMWGGFYDVVCLVNVRTVGDGVVSNRAATCLACLACVVYGIGLHGA